MRRRLLPATAAIAMLAAGTLAGCTSTTTNELCAPLIDSGPLSGGVQVSGNTSEELRVRVPAGADAFDAQRSVVREATSPGATAQVGSVVVGNLAEYSVDANEITFRSGSFGTGSGEQAFIADPSSSAIAAALVCAQEGETLAIALSPNDTAAIGGTGTSVVVLEIVNVFAPQVEGRTKALPTGFPAVTRDASGNAGVVLPPQDAPTKTKSALRIVGNGEKIGADQQVVGSLLSVDWNGEVTSNTHGSSPINFGNESQIEVSGATFRSALTGVPVGSQVVVIEPAIDAGQPAQVHVVDVLGVL